MSAGELTPISIRQGTREVRLPAPPETGTWPYGFKVYNKNPTEGAPVGWVCIVAGEPGTWQPFGVIGAGAGAWEADTSDSTYFTI